MGKPLADTVRTTLSCDRRPSSGWRVIRRRDSSPLLVPRLLRPPERRGVAGATLGPAGGGVRSRRARAAPRRAVRVREHHRVSSRPRCDRMRSHVNRQRSGRRNAVVTWPRPCSWRRRCGACRLRRPRRTRNRASRSTTTTTKADIVGAQPKGLSAANAPMRVTFGTGSIGAADPTTTLPNERGQTIQPEVNPGPEHHHQERSCVPAGRSRRASVPRSSGTTSQAVPSESSSTTTSTTRWTRGRSLPAARSPGLLPPEVR